VLQAAIDDPQFRATIEHIARPYGALRSLTGASCFSPATAAALPTPAHRR